MKRILVVFGKHLIASALESLLSREKELQVLTTAFTSQEDFLSTIDGFQPDAIILDERILSHEFAMFLGMMERFSKLFILVIPCDHNEIHLYSKRIIQLHRSSDLVATLID